MRSSRAYPNFVFDSIDIASVAHYCVLKVYHTVHVGAVFS